MDKLITDFVVHVDRAELSGEFKGRGRYRSRGDPTADGVVGVIEEELGENRDGEARLPGVVETPLDAGIGLTQAKFSRGKGFWTRNQALS